jgi:hypothetical protein
LAVHVTAPREKPSSIRAAITTALDELALTPYSSAALPMIVAFMTA